MDFDTMEQQFLESNNESKTTIKNEGLDSILDMILENQKQEEKVLSILQQLDTLLDNEEEENE